MIDRTREFYAYIPFDRGVFACSHFEQEAANLWTSLKVPGLDFKFLQLEQEPANLHEAAIADFLAEQIQDAAKVSQQRMAKEHKKRAVMDAFFKPHIDDCTGDSGAAMTTTSFAPETAAQYERENAALLTHYSSYEDQLEETARKAELIGSFINIFSGHVAAQQEKVAQIHHQAEKSTAHVEKAHDHLTRAKERGESYKFFIVAWFLIAAKIILFLDWMF